MIFRTTVVVLVHCLLTACSGGGSGAASSLNPISGPIAAVGNADVKLLFMGNSHTSVNDIPGTVATMVRAGKVGKTVVAVLAPGGQHLEERAGDAATLELLQNQRWNFVVLQAQDYSLSGAFFYPTTGAEKLVRLSRQAGALPVLFAEWPRVGILETQIIYSKYVSIAMKEPACVAPIPQAFDLALTRFPALRLHDPDGNHSAPAGAFLAALILYATITGNAPQNLPTLTIANVDADTQAKLRGIAAESLQSLSPRQWCSADPLLP